MKNLSELEKRLNLRFKKIELLREALTHRSYLNEHRSKKLSHNERLEFLGDAVLELAVTRFLFSKYPDKPEGELTALRAALVNTNRLFMTARKLKIGDFLLLSRGEAKDAGKARKYILANALEAIIGAIYLDQGHAAAEKFVLKHITSEVDKILERGLWRDPKSWFQETAQEVNNITPTYKVLREWGPDHAKQFVVGLYLGDELIAKGKGSSKHEAEVSAARAGLKLKGWG
jgi:ribonuclease-3